MLQDIKYIYNRCGWLILPFFILLCCSVTILQTYLMSIFSLLLLVFLPKKRYVNNESLLLLIFSILYSLIMVMDGKMNFISTSMIFTLLSPIMFYCFGEYVVDKLRHPNLIVVFFLLLTLLFSLNLYISIFFDIKENGFINVFRQVKVLGFVVESNKSGTLAATLLGLNASLGFVGLAIFAYYRKKLNVWVRSMFLILTILSLVAVVHLINRTGLVVLVVSFFAVTFYHMKRNFWSVLGVLVIGIIVVYFAYSFSWVNEDILKAYEEREIEGHSVAEGGGRTKRWTDAIKLLVKHPWGYSDLRGVKVHHAHNLWLDVGRVAGVLPLVVLLIATILYGINFLKLLSKDDGFLCSIFLVYNVVFFLSCMVEPIMEGFSLYFFLYVMFWGMQNQYLKLLKLNKYKL